MLTNERRPRKIVTAYDEIIPIMFELRRRPKRQR